MDAIIHSKDCPGCGAVQAYTTAKELRRAIKRKTMCYSCRTYSSKTREKMSVSASKKQLSLLTKEKLSNISKERYKNPLNLRKMSDAVKQAMHRPEVRKRHVDALHHSQWLKVRTDKGQLELLSKWNRIGFKFEPNYQIHTDMDLFYVDGYDKDHNVVLEFDSKYHQKISQKQKDADREIRIINILHPKKFWRYNSHTQSFTEIMKG